MLEQKLRTILEEKVNKITPSNIKKGVRIFDIEGTYEGSGGTVEGAKIFKTEEEMRADPNPQEGDLAVVYRSEIQNATVDSRFQTATFPQTVVLDTAVTDYIDVRYRAVDDSVMFDCWGSLDSSMFMMDCYTESGSIRIQYESSDGITYTRTIMQGYSGNLENPVDFGTEIYYERPEMWNDAIGKFIQCGGMYFEGLYEYGNTTDNEYGFAQKENIVINDYVASLNNISLNPNITNDMLTEAITAIKSEYPYTHTIGYFSGDLKTYTVLMTENNYSSAPSIVKDISTGKYYIGRYVYGLNSSDTSVVVKCTYNFETKTYESTIMYSSKTQLDTDYKVIYKETNNVYIVLTEIPDGAYILGGDKLTSTQVAKVFVCSGLKTVVTDCGSINIVDKYYYDAYIPAQNQFNLSKPNELLPGKIAYGKNGVVEGDNSVYDNLDNKIILENKFGIPFNTLSNAVGAINMSNNILYPLKITDNGKYIVGKTETAEDSALYSYFSSDNSTNLRIYSDYFTLVRNGEVIYNYLDSSMHVSGHRCQYTGRKNDIVTMCIYSSNTSFDTSKYILKIDLIEGTVTTVFDSKSLSLPNSTEKYSSYGYSGINGGNRYSWLTARGKTTTSPYYSEVSIYIYDSQLEQGKEINFSFSNTKVVDAPSVPLIYESYDKIGICFENLKNNNTYKAMIYESNIGELNFVKIYDRTNPAYVCHNSNSSTLIFYDDNYWYSFYNETYIQRYSKSDGSSTSIKNPVSRGLWIMDDDRNMWGYSSNAGSTLNITEYNISVVDENVVFDELDSIYYKSIDGYLSQINSACRIYIKHKENNGKIECYVSNVENSIVEFSRCELSDLYSDYDMLVLAIQESRGQCLRIISDNTNYNGTISPAEYTNALDTAKEIKGEEPVEPVDPAFAYPSVQLHIGERDGKMVIITDFDSNIVYNPGVDIKEKLVDFNTRHDIGRLPRLCIYNKDEDCAYLYRGIEPNLGYYDIGGEYYFGMPGTYNWDPTDDDLERRIVYQKVDFKNDTLGSNTESDIQMDVLHLTIGGENKYVLVFPKEILPDTLSQGIVFKGTTPIVGSYLYYIDDKYGIVKSMENVERKKLTEEV